MRCCESGGGGSTEAAMGVVGPYDAQISRTPHSREPKTISNPSATFGPSSFKVRVFSTVALEAYCGMGKVPG